MQSVSSVWRSSMAGLHAAYPFNHQLFKCKRCTQSFDWGKRPLVLCARRLHHVCEACFDVLTAPCTNGGRRTNCRYCTEEDAPFNNTDRQRPITYTVRVRTAIPHISWARQIVVAMQQRQRRQVEQLQGQMEAVEAMKRESERRLEEEKRARAQDMDALINHVSDGLQEVVVLELGAGLTLDSVLDLLNDMRNGASF